MDSTARFGSDHGALRSEDEPLLTGRGRFTDDLNVPGQAYGGVRARAGQPCGDPRRSMSTAARAMPGVLGVYTGAGRVADGLGAIPPVAVFPGRDGKPMFAAAMPVLARRSHPLRRRAGRDRGGARRSRRRRTPPRRCASTTTSCRARRISSARSRSGAAAIHAAARRATSRSTGPTAMRPRSTPRSRRPRMSNACGSSTRGSRRSRWSRAPASASFDPASRPLHADRQHAGRRGGAQAAGRGRVQGAAHDHPRADARRRRRLRHEGAGLSGIRRDPLRGAQMRPAGEVVQQPDGELPLRLGRARRHSGRRARARRQGQVPRPARARSRRHRRLHDAIRGDLRDHEHEELPLQRLPHSGDRTST